MNSLNMDYMGSQLLMEEFYKKETEKRRQVEKDGKTSEIKSVEPSNSVPYNATESGKMSPSKHFESKPDNMQEAIDSIVRDDSDSTTSAPDENDVKSYSFPWNYIPWKRHSPIISTPDGASVPANIPYEASESGKFLPPDKRLESNVESVETKNEAHAAVINPSENDQSGIYHSFFKGVTSLVSSLKLFFNPVDKLYIEQRDNGDWASLKAQDEMVAGGLAKETVTETQQEQERVKEKERKELSRVNQGLQEGYGYFLTETQNLN